MSTELTAQEMFQQKMSDRIRDSIGDLMPDEVLQKIISNAVEKAFFERQHVGNEWNRHLSEPWIQKLARELVSNRVNEFTNEWLDENKGRIEEVVSQQLDMQLLTAVCSAFNRVFASEFALFKDNLEMRLQQMTFS